MSHSSRGLPVCMIAAIVGCVPKPNARDPVCLLHPCAAEIDDRNEHKGSFRC